MVWPVVCLVSMGLNAHGFVSQENAIQLANRWRPSIYPLALTDGTEVYGDPCAIRSFAAAMVHLHALPNAMGCVMFVPDMTLFVVEANGAQHTVHAVLWGRTARGRGDAAADELRTSYEALVPPISVSFASHVSFDS
jgi:hypothetical protein